MDKRKFFYFILSALVVVIIFKTLIPLYIQEVMKTDRYSISSHATLLFIVLFIWAQLWLLRVAYYHGRRKLGFSVFFVDIFYFLKRKNFTKIQWIINLFMVYSWIILFILLFIIAPS